MAANLFGERYVGTETAWHGLGKHMDKGTSALEALELAQMDYTVSTVKIPNIVVDGQEIQYDNGRLIVRHATHDSPAVVLGQATKDFTPVQNREIAEVLEPLSKKWNMSTLGALGQGERVFFTLDMGDKKIAGDEFNRYMLVSDSKLPGGSLIAVATNVRVVCQNTLWLALQTGMVQLSLTHSAGVSRRFADFTAMELAFISAQENTAMFIEQLAKKRMNIEQVKKAIGLILPVPPTPKNVKAYDAAATLGKALDKESELGKDWEAQKSQHKRNVESTLMNQDELMITFEQQNEADPKHAFTAYNLFNAVTGWADHSEQKAQTERAKRETAESTLFGARARIKQNAAKVLLPTFYTAKKPVTVKA